MHRGHFPNTDFYVLLQGRGHPVVEESKTHMPTAGDSAAMFGTLRFDYELKDPRSNSSGSRKMPLLEGGPGFIMLSRPALVRARLGDTRRPFSLGEGKRQLAGIHVNPGTGPARVEVADGARHVKRCMRYMPLAYIALWQIQ